MSDLGATRAAAAERRNRLRLAQRECARIARHEASNFYWGFVALPHDKRTAIYALYSFARQVDDEADSGRGGAEAGIQRQRERLRSCLRGTRDDAVTVTLGQAVDRYGIQAAELEEVVDGVAMDLHPPRFASWDELELYCRRVAGAVGRMCVRIFGDSSPKGLDRANRLGLALQLTNILRDVREDAGMDRCYLPLDDLARFGMTAEDVLALRCGDGWEGFVAHQVERARGLYAEGMHVCDHIPHSSAACVRTMAGIYHGILEEIAEHPRRVLDERISLTPRRKLSVAVGAWLHL